MSSYYFCWPWLRQVLENFADYDTDRQKYIEQRLEDIMTLPGSGSLLSGYQGQEPPDILLPGKHNIGERFRGWLEGYHIPAEAPAPLTAERLYREKRLTEARCCEDKLLYTSTLPLLDLEQAMIIRAGCQIPLTPVERNIMTLLFSARGRVVTYRRFEEWAQAEGDGAACYEPKHHIRHLREKLGDDRRRPVLIANRRGIGYSLSPLVQAINSDTHMTSG